MPFELWLALVAASAVVSVIPGPTRLAATSDAAFPGVVLRGLRA
ncbi:hypothetical protein [Pseudorhodoferax sp. Leaf267]|nr:hypothetical protein [Pseudorhodoferax sp. Leaf267]